MKKLFFLILILLQGLGANCQTPAALTTPSPDQTAKQTVHRKGFSLEPLAGLGTSEAVQNGTNNLGWKAGCGVVYMFNEHWGISSGLQVQRYSTTVVTAKDSMYATLGRPPYWEAFNINTTYNFTYWELPLIVRYISSKNKKIGVFAETGFIFGFLFSRTEASTLYGNSFDTIKGYPFPSNGGYLLDYTISLPHITPKATPFNFQGHFGIGLFVPISQRCSIMADFSINRGFTNTGNSSNDVANIYGLSYYYYKSNNNYNPNVSDYGTDFSELFSIRLNIKL